MKNRLNLMLSQSAEDENDLFDDYVATDKKRCDDEIKRDESGRYSFRLTEQSSYTPANMRVSLSWTNVSARSESKQLLSNLSGTAKPGELLVIMGELGAGKTTFLNIIGGRPMAKSFKIDGAIEMNGIPLRQDLVRRFAGFVCQEDVFPALLTVWEYLWFHTKLRMTGEDITDKIRSARVEALLRELGLVKRADTLIGDARSGGKALLSGERKRLSLATELITNPAILFLDEPTTGLDDHLAESVLQSLDSLAKEAIKTVIFTIQQPCSEIFSYFDRLILLSPDGRVCFQGTTADCRRFFASPPLMQQCYNDFNEADFYMNVICRDFRDNLDAIVDAYEASEYCKMVAADVEAVVARNFITVGPTLAQLSEIRPAGTTLQLQMSAWRAVKLYYRNPALFQTHLLQVILYAVAMGLIFFGLPLNPTGVANRCGALVQTAGINAWQSIAHYLDALPKERNVLVREYALGLHPPWVYFLTRQLTEVPLMLLQTVVTTTIIYVLAFLWQTGNMSGWLTALATGFLIALAASSIGYIFGFWADENNSLVPSATIQPLLAILALCNGFWINNESIPAYMQWLPYLSLFFYGTENMFIAEWGTNATLPECKTGRCLFQNGADVLKYYNFNSSHLWRNFWLLFALTVVCRLVALAILTSRTRRAILANYYTSPPQQDCYLPNPNLYYN